MKNILFLLLSFLLFACSKNTGSDSPITPPTPTPPVPPAPTTPTDTLATGWRKIMLPLSQTGSDIFFINSTTGFVAGSNFISRSNDGGNTWQKVYQSANKFENITIGSPLNAIFTTINENRTIPSKVITTFDGGNTFDSVMIADIITDAFSVSSSVAYAIGQKCWKTSNGGRNWTNIYDFVPGLPQGYRSFYFLNEQTGWLAGTGGVYKTISFGSNWSSQPVSAFNFTGPGNVFFTDANTGFISDLNSIGKSVNGGATWTKVYTLENNIYHDLHFLTPALGYVTDNQYIRKTTDGGTTWTREVRLVNTTDVIVEMHFTDADHGWACGGYNEGFILKYER